MKGKRYSLLALLLGFIILLAGIMLPYLCMHLTPDNGSTGIIGGADARTYQFLASRLLGGLPYVLALLGIALVISSGFCLIFSKTVKIHCNIKTSAISLGLSGVGALGLNCVLWWFTIVAFGKMSSYPIEYPVSILLGLLSFFAFVGLIVLYFKVRKANLSLIGIAIDVLTSIIYLPTFFLAFLYLISAVT